MAGAVLPDEDVHLSGVDLEVHVLEGGRSPVGLRDLLRAHEGTRVGSSRTHGRRGGAHGSSPVWRRTGATVGARPPRGWSLPRSARAFPAGFRDRGIRGPRPRLGVQPWPRRRTGSSRTGRRRRWAGRRGSRCLEAPARPAACTPGPVGSLDLDHRRPRPGGRVEVDDPARARHEDVEGPTPFASAPSRSRGLGIGRDGGQGARAGPRPGRWRRGGPRTTGSSPGPRRRTPSLCCRRHPTRWAGSSRPCRPATRREGEVPRVAVRSARYDSPPLPAGAHHRLLPLLVEDLALRFGHPGLEAVPLSRQGRAALRTSRTHSQPGEVGRSQGRTSGEVVRRTGRPRRSAWSCMSWSLRVAAVGEKHLQVHAGLGLHEIEDVADLVRDGGQGGAGRIGGGGAAGRDR